MGPKPENIAQQVSIVLVEDSPEDRMIIRDALEEHFSSVEIEEIVDGQLAISYFRQLSNGSSALPSLVFLDLNLPKRSGIEVLKEIRQLRNLNELPIIILSTSRSREDVLDSYDHGADSFYTKPETEEEVFQLMRDLEKFCLNDGPIPERSSRE